MKRRGVNRVVSFLLRSLKFTRRRSGSFPEQSNKMNERSVTWRQTNNAVYIYNRKQAGKPHHDWSYEKSPVTKVTGRGNQRFEGSKTASGIGVGRKTTNLEAQTCMDTGIWFRYLPTVKVK